MITQEFFLNRLELQDARTFGELTLDGRHLCWTLEDTDRGLYQGMSENFIKEFKEKGKTAIGSGRYQIKMMYSPRYKCMMPCLIGVDGFIGILIHGGQTEDDTMGCVLVAYNKNSEKIWGSAIKEIVKLITDAEKKGIETFITVN